MKESILNGKRIMAVDDDPDILAMLEKEIRMAAPNCYIDKASNYQRATELFASLTYDLIILDTAFARTFDLLELEITRPSPYPVVILIAHTVNPETLRRFTGMGVRAYLPKDKLSEAVPLLEDVLKYEYLPFWRRIFEPLRGLLNTGRRRTLVEVRS